MENVIKPNKTAYLIFSMIISGSLLALIIIASIIASIFLKDQFESILQVLMYAGAFGLVLLYQLIDIPIRYRKTEYEFKDDRIIMRTGGLLSDKKSELEYRNITYARLTYPFILNKLFGTGQLSIDSAGSQAVAIQMVAMDNAEELFEKIKSNMKKSGFSLQHKKELCKAKADSIGCFLEAYGFGTIVIVYILFRLFTDTPIDTLTYKNVLFFIFIGLVSIVFPIFRYLDLKRREYIVYDDMILYTEGFLTTHFVFIPRENLADAQTKQGLLSRILGIYDITVSCQGSKKEVHFRNIKDGIAMQDAIRSLEKEKPATITHKKHVTPAKVHKKVNTDAGSVVQELRMNGARAFIPVLLTLPLVPIFVLWIISRFVQYSGNTYQVLSRGLAQNFTFISKKNTEFSDDRITGMVIHENPFDRFFNTMTVEFWSVGSGDSLSFRHIKKDDALINTLRQRLGYISEKKVKEIKSEMTLGSYVANNIPILLMAGGFSTLLSVAFFFFKLPYSLIFGFLAAIAVIYVAGFVIGTIYYNRSRMSIREDYFVIRKGVFFVRHFFIQYEDAKDIQITKYPFIAKGSITVSAAGEKEIEKKDDKKSYSSYSAGIGYVSEVTSLADFIDERLLGTPLTKKDIEMVKPDVGNTLLRVGVPAFFFFSFGFPVVVALAWWYVAKKSFHIQKERMLGWSGIFYRRRTSVLLNRFDFTTTRQGPINKLFNNGTIAIHTIGSGKAELTIHDVSDYHVVEEKIKAAAK